MPFFRLFCLSGLFLLFGFFLMLFMPEHGFRPTPREERNNWQHMAHTFKGGANLVRLRPALLNILLVGLIYGLYSEGYDRLWTRHLLDRFSLPVLDGLPALSWFAIIQTVGLLLSMAVIEIARRRLDTGSHAAMARALLLVTAILVAALLGYAWMDQFGWALAMIWMVGAARSVIDPVYTAWVNQRLDSRVRATVLSMSSQVDAMGQIAGGPAVGLIGNLVSVRAALTASALILAPQLVLLGRSQKAAVLPEPEARPAD